MRIQTTDRLLVDQTQYEHRYIYGGIPGSRYNKAKGRWEMPRSPFTAARLSSNARREGIRIEADAGFQDLLLEMEAIKDSQKWKTADCDSMMFEHMFETATTPWNHQALAALFIEDKRAAYLAMEMGTGKTLVAINEILRSKAMRVLIVCPKSVLQVWRAEFHEHVADDVRPILVVLDKGSTKQKNKLLEFQWRMADTTNTPLAVVINYDSVWRAGLGESLLRREWDMVILDEAHRIKTPKTHVSKFARQLSRKARRRLCLSGTPIPNTKLDAFGQWRFLDVGVFGDYYTRFKARYAEFGGYGGYELVGYKNEKEFNWLLDQLTFRVDKDVLDLPDVMHVRKYCELGGESARVYKNLEKVFISDVRDGVVTAANALTRLLRLQQITSGFVKTEEGDETELGKHKERLLNDVLGGIDAGEPVVVFCRFRHDLRVVREAAEDLERVYGELSGEQNDLIDGKIPKHIKILGVQIQAGGLGVNLVAARYCIFYSIGFALADYLQAEARVHRGGQDRPVTYIHLLAENSVDERIYEAIREKKEIVDEILAYIKRESR